MGAASIAIWKKNKFILAIAMSVWGANIPFLILCRSLSIRHGDDHGPHLNLISSQVSYG